MNSWINGAPNADPIGTQSPSIPLDSLAAEVDRQLVLDLGGEFLEGSGFEAEKPEPDFETEGEGYASRNRRSRSDRRAAQTEAGLP